MARTNFEGLEVYRLSERLADEIWAVVSSWDRFAKDTVGKQIVSGRRQYWSHHRRRNRER
jgi:hypothetical protein